MTNSQRPIADSQPAFPNADNITRAQLDNGITILVYENHAAQSVVILGTFRAGSAHESPDKNGLASLTIDSLLRGTETRSFDAINTALENNAADLNISAGRLRSSFFGKALAEDLSLLTGLLNDALREPTFPADHIERLRGEILTSLHYSQQDTRYRAYRAYYETLYPPDHPYHHSPRGLPNTVQAITLDEARDFHQQHVHPDGMIVVVVGAVDAQAAIDMLGATLGDWQAAALPAEIQLPDAPSLSTTQRVFVPLPGKMQTDIVLGAIGPSRLDSDFKAAQLANNILGQFGMMGRIGAIVREELGLAYEIYSQVEGGLIRAPWTVAAGVDPANVERAIDHILIEIRRLITEPVSAEEMADNQSFFIGHLPLQLESNEDIASNLLNIEVFDLGLDYLLTYRDLVRNLTREAVLAAAQRYLKPDALAIAIAGSHETSHP